MKYQYTKHVAGKPEGKIQRCILCDAVIRDLDTVKEVKGQDKPKLFRPGEVWVLESAPEFSTSEQPVHPEAIMRNCQQPSVPYGDTYRRVK